MPQLQPDIMIVNGANQQRCHSGTVCTKNVRIDLIPYKSGVLPICFLLLYGTANTAHPGLCSMYNTGDLIFPAKVGDTGFMAIGYNAQVDPRIFHPAYPKQQLCRGGILRIGEHGIIKIHQQKCDLPIL